MQITREELARLCPRPADSKKARIWDGYVDAICASGPAFLSFEVSTPPRWAHFIGQCAVETGGFTRLWEDMNYRADRIVTIFGPGRHSASVPAQEAARLAGNPYALAERVYGVGNPVMAQRLGNRAAGDGYRFRGVGIIQLTGGNAHRQYAAVIGCSLEQLADPNNALLAALLFWRDKGCNKFADLDDVVGVRRLVNGGRNGLDEVRAKVAKAKLIWPTLHGGELPRPQPRPADEWVVLELGQESPRIAELQRNLVAAGFACGTDNGVFGPLTERMVFAFQGTHGLPANGKVDRATWDAIAAAAAAQPAAVPGRQDLDEAELGKRGSGTVKSGWFARMWGKIVGYFTGGVAVDEVGGFGVVDSGLNQLEHARGLVGRTGSLFGTLVSGKVLAIVAGGILAYLLIRFAKQLIDNRVEAAKSGANLGR